MEPLISLTIRNPKPAFMPGEILECEYQIDAIGEDQIQSTEASVLWYTEGKGDEDIGLHFFERRLPGDALDGDLRELHRFQTRCPNSPLSYNGNIVKVRWCVRVRVFLHKGKEIFFELPFVLGDLPTQIRPPETDEEQSEDAKPEQKLKSDEAQSQPIISSDQSVTETSSDAESTPSESNTKDSDS